VQGVRRIRERGAVPARLPHGLPGEQDRELRVDVEVRHGGGGELARVRYPGLPLGSVALLERTFEETDGYDEIVLLRDIRLESHCEHHMVPIIGRAHVAYLPHRRVVGISKLARVVEAFAKRLQIQERMTAQIAGAIEEALRPEGVGVVFKAVHHCMSARGVHKPGVELVTSRMLGSFRNDPATRQEFLRIAASPPAAQA